MNSESNERTTPWRIATDTGGTFTDCYALTPQGEEVRCKVLSTGCLRSQVVRCSGSEVVIADDWRTVDGFFAGFVLRAVGDDCAHVIVRDWKVRAKTLVCESNVPNAWQAGTLLELSSGEEAPVLGARLLTHTALGQAFPSMQFRVATTRATNALLERKGSRVGLFITQGFGDLPVIGDQRRSDLFALKHEPRPRFHEVVCEVPERLDAHGHVLTALNESAVIDAARGFVQQGITQAAVALLHSHVNAAHEQRVAELLRDAGFAHVSVSSELAPFVKLLPRAQSAIANAYLTGPVQSFLQGVATPLLASSHKLPASSLHVMTSAAGLVHANAIAPKDMLLSGPAGGAIGAAKAALSIGHTKIITLDMGGTSTDVARIEEGQPGYRFTQSIEGMNLLAPCVAVETVAAGGGSICAWTASGLEVGPHSAGSNPGPACYGRGGPLTITDVNLLLGRFDPARAPIPLDVHAAEARLVELQSVIKQESGRMMQREELLHALLSIAVEHMAAAIRRISVSEGYDPASYALLAFGGAGPQHACAVAARLGMKTILVPKHAGILSAVGLHQAVPEVVMQKQVLLPLEEALPQIAEWVASLRAEGARTLAGDDVRSPSAAAASAEDRNSSCRPLQTTEIASCLIELRLRGQDTPLQVSFTEVATLPSLYAAAYQRLFGYAPPKDRVVELVSLRVVVRVCQAQESKDVLGNAGVTKEAPPCETMRCIQDEFSTLVIEAGWSKQEIEGFGYVLKDAGRVIAKSASSHELARHRFHSLVDDMGALLQRTSISTNIRERLDFSCALLDANGTLIASAPHIPVHLGALGVCVRETLRCMEQAAQSETTENSSSKLQAASPPHPGDTWITNHPAFGGSHLPDVTLITPVFDEANALLGFVANRAHHAEIGGMTPGSMPANATCLAQEGVVIAPRYLVRAGEPMFDDVAALLQAPPYPTRNLADNLADLHAQLAANRLGTERLRELAHEFDVGAAMQAILDHSAQAMQRRLVSVPDATATEALDDGFIIHVQLRSFINLEPGTKDRELTIDFTGTSSTHSRNLNATNAIVNSAVLYVLRLLLQEDLPLNEGLLRPVRIVLPEGTMLRPNFTGDAMRDPAVVGGNVEVSQRLVDTLIKALQLQSCSQGTMNNLLFGNERFGYYETIAGGAGAGDGYEGASALHTHMTNTAITDPEILEQRYPVRLRQFAIRRDSGGEGHWQGGDGVVREFEFLAPLTVSLLTQHRTSGPFGLHGGGDGRAGLQRLMRGDQEEVLPSSASIQVNAGDVLRMETPGGGGFGKSP